MAETLIGTANNIASHPKGAHILSQEDLKLMVNSADAEGNSALHWAARKNHEAVAVLLIEAGATIDLTNKEESTPLHWAARKHNAALLELLLAGGASPFVFNKWGATALDNAVAVAGGGATAQVAIDLLRRKEKVLRAKQQKQQQGQQQGEPPPPGSAEGAAGGAGGGSPSTGAAGAAERGSSSSSPVWGEGPGVTSGKPRGMKAKAAARRKAANERREAALKARDAQEDEKAKTMKLRRQRQAVELRLKGLCDAISLPPAPSLPPQPAAGAGGRNGRSASPPKEPPKAQATKALREALDEATALGGCNTTVIGAAVAMLKHAEELRERAKRDAARAAEKQRGRSPGGKKLPGEKNPEEEMAKLERKLLRQQARGR